MTAIHSLATPQRDERILIVGAGPVGLILALKLAGNGIASTVMETYTHETFLTQVSRAGSNHPITLEMFADVGVYDKLEPRGLIAPTFQYWDRQSNELIAEFDHALIADQTPYPFVLQCERIKIIDEALRVAMSKELIDLRMGAEFESFTQTGDYVDATMRMTDGSIERVRGRYIVSCEGARSLVRKACDIEYEGFTYTDRTLNLGVVYDFKQHGYSDRNYISDPGEWMNLFHWPGPPEVWRVHFHTDPDMDEATLLSEDYCQGVMQAFLPQATPYEIVTRRLFSIHQRVAKKFRHGRALLAGDSAHSNSPIGGMGMNSGVHDAMNLAEKLTAVMRGADDALLDRYERQRRTIAIEHVQAQTISNKKLLTEKDPAARRANHDQLRRTAADPKLARSFLMRASMIDSVREANAIA